MRSMRKGSAKRKSETSMGSDGETQIIRLLTQLRDAQREEFEYRRQMMDETVRLQKRAARLQRIVLMIVLVLVAVALVLIVGMLVLIALTLWAPR